MDRDVYFGLLSLHGEEHRETLSTAFNYANTLNAMRRFEEAKSLLCRSIPAARRALGESHEVTLRMSWNYAGALVMADNATLDDLHEAVATFEEIKGTARRVLGGTHPHTESIEHRLREARAALRARRNAELRAAFKEDPSSLSADDRARAEQLLARDARKAAQKKAGRRVGSV